MAPTRSPTPKKEVLMYAQYVCQHPRCGKLFTSENRIAEAGSEVIARIKRGTLFITVEDRYTFVTLDERPNLADRAVFPTYLLHPCENLDAGLGKFVGFTEKRSPAPF